MAIEFTLEATPVLSEAKALDYFADLLGCEHRHTATYAARADLQVDTATWPTKDDPEIRALLGDEATYLSVTFREVKNIGGEASAAVEGDMINAVVRFFEDHLSTKGIFVYNGEEILLQRLGEGIVLDERLRRGDYNRHGLLDPLLVKYPVRRLEQVFL
ncbi:SitI3 family protein [Glycomyces harbinensis]|uniref:Uncharacterized protein n=1 Tax=Glycomyces harbinensis TaxID=58114 RepID=A0A1G6R3P1_9ACTN|nr:SitI3 family protein [Glycomyces harbinensis]SDC99260.1 hypothetical protein SAMN05216270_101279 [Glycomyces harbinensis]